MHHSEDTKSNRNLAASVFTADDICVSDSIQIRILLYILKRDSLEIQHPKFENSRLGFINISEVSSSAVEKICEVSSIAVQLVLLTTHGTAKETICEDVKIAV